MHCDTSAYSMRAVLMRDETKLDDPQVVKPCRAIWASRQFEIA